MSYIPRMDRSSRGKVLGKCPKCGGILKTMKDYKTLAMCQSCKLSVNKEYYGV